MTSAWEYFGKISSFGDSGLALTATLTANLAFTGIHIWEEAKGAKAPLYRAFGGIVGVCLPRPVGIAVFTVLLALVQWTAGLAAYAGWPPFLGSDCWQISITALGFVLGARIADSVISHWRLYLAGFRPNPGIRSTVLYTLEAGLILLMFQPGLHKDATAAWIGFAGGWVLFLSVLPLMWFTGVFFKSWRRERWVRGKEMPPWVLERDCE